MTRIELLTAIGIVVAVVSGIVVPLLLQFLNGRGARRKPGAKRTRVEPAEMKAQAEERVLPAYRAELHSIESPGFYVFLALLSPVTGVLNGRQFMQSDYRSSRKTGRYSFVFGLVGIVIVGATALLLILSRSLWVLLGGAIAYFAGLYITAGVVFYKAFCGGAYDGLRKTDLKAIEERENPQSARPTSYSFVPNQWVIPPGSGIGKK